MFDLPAGSQLFKTCGGNLYQLDPLPNRILPVEFPRGLLNCTALRDISRWIFLVVSQCGGSESLELLSLDRRHDPAALIGLERKMPDWCADHEPARRGRLHDW